MNRKYSRGMTILETCIAVVILGIVISGVLRGLYLAGHIGATTKNCAKAIQIAKGRMEEVMTESYVDLVNGVGNGYLYDNSGQVPYTLTTSVTPEYEGGQEIGKMVTLRIDWLQQSRNCYERLVTFRKK